MRRILSHGENSSKRNSLKANSPKNENGFADKNVSRGQMRDQIVAIRAVFC
jgi:hypothetical protein